MTAMQPNDTRRVFTAELAAAQAEFHAILASLSDEAWRKRSNNPGWTNGEIVFHMAIGFFLLPFLLPLIRLAGRLPRGATKPFAAVLNLSTTPFNWVNAFGPRIGGRLLRRRTLGNTYDRVIARTLRTIDRIRDDEWQRGMYYPSRWDALFSDYMTLETLLRYPIVHLRFHTGQLSR